MILVDTNILSESSRTSPERHVMQWMNAHFSDLFLPTPVLAELRYGCSKLPQSAGRDELERWLADLLVGFGDRIAPFDRYAAEAHGNLRAHLQLIGKPCPPGDSYIAAIALSLGWPLATRDVDDFAWTGVELINPWNS